MTKEELDILVEKNPIKTVEDYQDKIKELKVKHDAFLDAVDEVLEARKYIIDDKVFVQEIEDMGNLRNVTRRKRAHDNLRQLRLWNPNR